ncbi:MAG: ABC transporter permease, partial [bacterium]|nr:ABC transporter permease [bacterium]
MNVLVSFRVAIRALLVNKLRSVLTMLGVIIGVGAVIVMVAVGSGAQARVTEQIQSLGSNLIIVISGARTAGGARLGRGFVMTLTEDDAQAMQRELPNVLAAAPSIRRGGQVVFGHQNWSTTIYGVTPEYFEVRAWQPALGRFFSGEEVARSDKVAILGKSVVENLFGGLDPVGQIIRIKKIPFTVIGTLEAKGQTGWGNDQDDVILIPLSTAKKKVLGVDATNIRKVAAIMVNARSAATVGKAEAEIRSLLRQRHRIPPGQPDDFWIRNLSEILQAREESSRVLSLLLASIASISLLVGGIGIMNIMLVSVTERTREIGLRMAIGARARDILTQFLVEALVLALVGGFFGIAAGISAAAAVANFAGWPVMLQSEAVVISFVFSGAVGIFFGYYPARQASRVLPI